MAPIPALTKAEFFRRYDFDFNPRASLYAEFLRLAESRKWQEGSKSKKFESAWSECFGLNVSVGNIVDQNTTEMEPQHSINDENLSSLLCSMQKLDIGKKTKKKGIKIKAVEPEFNSQYGNDDSVKAKWQALCQDCGVDPPPSIIKCKKALKGLNINIFEFLEAKREGRLPYRFGSRKKLAEYMLENPKRRYPLEMAKRNRFLSVLLIECW